jgi:ABC-2 type transport system ATP-binding protein
MIELKSVVKNYRGRLAVNNVSFNIGRGEIVGLLGANGAGKSTIMNMITGYVAMTSGTITIDGMDILEEPIGVRKKIGYLPEQAPLYMDMTIEEYLNLVLSLKKSKLNAKDEVDRVCRMMDIIDVKGRLIKHLSKGYKQRVGFAQALLGKPDILILDEPTVGLDPNQIIEFRKIIRKLGEDHTIILSTHILSEVESVCQRVLVMDKGNLVADDITKNLLDHMKGLEQIRLCSTGNEAKIKDTIRHIPGVRKIEKVWKTEQDSNNYIVLIDKKAASKNIRIEITKRLAEKGMYVIEMEPESMKLEEVFQKLTSEDNKEVK